MRISFIHSGDISWASYRYRAFIPAHLLGATINDWSADVVVLAKPAPHEIAVAKQYQQNGGKVLVDICDDHFDRPCYREAAQFADGITCPTHAMRAIIRYRTHRGAHVIPETFELPELQPHCHGPRLLWFGHLSNWASLERVRPFIEQYPLEIVSNHPHATIPWSTQATKQALATADMVILPATSPGKSPNRAVEAIRSGCFVVAEPHRSLMEFPGIWAGEDIERGIAWALAHPKAAEQGIIESQRFVAKQFAPDRIADLWRVAVADVCEQTEERMAFR